MGVAAETVAVQEPSTATRGRAAACSAGAEGHSRQERRAVSILEKRYANSLVLTFAQIEDLLGFRWPPLPGSIACGGRTTTSTTRSGLRRSLDTGEPDATVNLGAQTVLFERIQTETTAVRSRHGSARVVQLLSRARPRHAAFGASVTSTPRRSPNANRLGDPVPERLQLGQRLGRKHPVRDDGLAVIDEDLDRGAVEEHQKPHPAVAPARRRGVAAWVRCVERRGSRSRAVHEHLERVRGDADQHLFAGGTRQAKAHLAPRAARRVEPDLRGGRQRPRPGHGAAGPRSASSSRTGCCTSRRPSGSGQGQRPRYRQHAAPREVGSSLAYSQLLIQPIQMRRPSAVGMPSYDIVA